MTISCSCDDDCSDDPPNGGDETTSSSVRVSKSQTITTTTTTRTLPSLPVFAAAAAEQQQQQQHTHPTTATAHRSSSASSFSSSDDSVDSVELELEPELELEEDADSPALQSCCSSFSTSSQCTISSPSSSSSSALPSPSPTAAAPSSESSLSSSDPPSPLSPEEDVDSSPNNRLHFVSRTTFTTTNNSHNNNNKEHYHQTPAHNKQQISNQQNSLLIRPRHASNRHRHRDVVRIPQTSRAYLGWDHENTSVLVLALAESGLLHPLSSIKLMPSPHKPITRPQILLRLWEPDILYVLKNSQDPKDFDDDFYEWGPEWSKLKAPLTAPRPRGIPALRHAANQEGVAIVIPARRPVSDLLQRAVEFSYGAQVVYVTDNDIDDNDHHHLHLHHHHHHNNSSDSNHTDEEDGFEILPHGLVLHPGNAPRLANRKRGRINPHIGWGTLHGQLNKWTEYLFAERTQHGAMAKTVRSDMLSFWQNPINQQMAVRARDCVLRLGLPSNAGVRNVRDAPCDELRSFYRQFFEALHGEFPDGAYLKHIGSCGTFATNQLVTSFNSNPDAMVDDFLECTLTELAQWHADSTTHQPDQLESVCTFLMKAIERTERPVPMFIWYNVADPTKTIIQQRLELAVTPLSQWPLEFRVDFIDGEPVSIFPRHCYEYFSEALTQKVDSFVREFFAAAEEPYRYLCGAADVAFLRDGSLRIIEFNFGAESGFIGPDIWGNTYVTKLIGRQTPLMQALEELFQSSLDGQKEVLRHVLSKTEDHDCFHEGFGLSYWLRDRYLAAFEMDPTPEKASRIMEDLQGLFSVVQDKRMSDHVDHLIKGALSFMNLTETD